jgi:uncharacterized protein YijF (DUF1287 family)
MTRLMCEFPIPREMFRLIQGFAPMKSFEHIAQWEIDLQKEVHEDMEQNFSAYPRKWRWLSGHTDANIDHRRVPNLMVFFSRKGEKLAITGRAEDYSPGELVTWDLGGNVPHIGIVVDQKSLTGGRSMILHNIGRGPRIEDVLFSWKITGHYRYFGPSIP